MLWSELGKLLVYYSEIGMLVVAGKDQAKKRMFDKLVQAEKIGGKEINTTGRTHLGINGTQPLETAQD